MFKNILFPIGFILLLFQSTITSNSCEKHTSCSDCIKDVNNCVWCTMNNFEGLNCKQNSSITDDWCPDHQQNPMSYIDKHSTENRDFSSLGDNIVQMKPQKYKLYLRPGQTVDFPFSFQVAEDYPVDIYFLLDMSASMEAVNDMATQQMKKIYLTMKNMTKNVTLGFGTFIDKNAFPFTDIINNTQTYSYQHHFKLSEDTESFEKTIATTHIGYNFDTPESSLEALAQTMACKDVVGWRNQSTKIVILTTDAPYHIAGDGKNGGIFEPYDGKCYTVDNRYTKELEMDYPTVGAIKKLSISTEIIVIFFVEKDVQAFYHDLIKKVGGWKCKTFDKLLLNNDDDMFVMTLQQIYKQITKQVKFKVNVRSGSKKNIHITFDPDCDNLTTDYNICKTKKNEKLDFTGTIKLLEYDNIDNLLIDIGIEGISDKLTLDVDVIKECECEKEGKPTEYCSNEIQQCGICICGEKRYGDRCACEKNSVNSVNDDSSCKAIGSNETCSNAGICLCGTCRCSPGFNGKFCQCNDNSCPHGHGGHCNGPDKGICECGKCRCKSPWSGDTCECLNSQEDCMGPDNKICSGLGTCECNRCKCQDVATWDGRNIIDEAFCKLALCHDCIGYQCDLIAHCVLCELGYKEECLDCEAVERNVTKSLDTFLNSTEWIDCPELRVKVGCYTHYVFKYKEDVYGMLVQIREKLDCTGGYYIYGGVSLLTLLLIGIATLVAWRMITEAHYKSEYDKFLKEHNISAADLCDNPLYEAPCTTIRNPTYEE